MTIPSLKRIRISNQADLKRCLSQHDDDLMLVTNSDASHPKHVNIETVQSALAAHGWTSNRRYTLTGSQIGHAVSKTA